MHLFLTGKVQIGKTTVVDKTIARLGVTPGGFRTYFGEDRRAPHHFLYMGSAAQPRSFAPDHAIAEFRLGADGVPTACQLLPRFEELGLCCLEDAQKYPMLLMDECGRLEQRLLAFRQRVLELLDGSTPILGVVREDAMDWLEEIRRHPGVQLIPVTVENRDRLPEEMAAYFMDLLEQTKNRKEKWE